MSKFKIGDKVRVNASWSSFYNNIGWIAEVVGGTGLPYTVLFDADEEEFNYFAEDELELIS